MAEDFDNEEYEENQSSDVLSASANKDSMQAAHKMSVQYDKEMVKGGYKKEFGSPGPGWTPLPSNKLEEIKKV